MKISFTDKITDTDHPVFIISEKTNKITSSLSHFNKDMISVLKYYLKDKKTLLLHSKHYLIETRIKFFTLR